MSLIQFLQAIGIYLLRSNFPPSQFQRKRSDYKSGVFSPVFLLSFFLFLFLSAPFLTSTRNSIDGAFYGDRDISRSERSWRHPGKTKTLTKISQNLLTLLLTVEFFSPSLFLSPGPPSSFSWTTWRRNRRIFQIWYVSSSRAENRTVSSHRACRKQFRNFPPWLCHLRFAIRLGEIEFSQVETGGAW